MQRSEQCELLTLSAEIHGYDRLRNLEPPLRWEPWNRQVTGRSVALLDSSPTRHPDELRMGHARVLADFAEQVLDVDQMEGTAE